MVPNNSHTLALFFKRIQQNKDEFSDTLLGDLLRYFDLKTKWDNRQYGLLSEDEVIFLSEGRKRYTGENFAALYYLWKRNQLPKDLRAEGFCNPNCEFKLMTVCGHDAVFGTETKRWGDGWKVRGSSRTNSPRRSLRLEVAAMLHVPVSWVYGRTRKRSAQRLPGIRLGKYWRFREEEIHKWIENQRGGDCVR